MADSKTPNPSSQIPITSAKLLVIVGPTASGKSALALEVAPAVDGEIICGDSRTVYKDMDIGTAKPSKAEQTLVRHHLLDVVDPDKKFTAADFKYLCNEAIDDIQARGKLPILVGGSGLYIDSVLFDFEFSATGSARDERNPRHLHPDVPRVRKPLRPHTLVVGLNVERGLLKERISKRVEQMIADGFLEEVKRLVADYPKSRALQAPGYKAFAEHLKGRLSMEEAKALFIKNDLSLAKRQMTWFRRNKAIHWLDDPNTYVGDTLELLNKLQ